MNQSKNEQRNQEFRKLFSEYAQLSLSFPVTFTKGITYTHMTVCCANCGLEVEDENVHGEIKPVTENMSQMKAVAYCQSCHLLTPAEYRLYAEGYFVGLQNGKWTRYDMKPKVSLLKKMIKFLF